MRKIIERLTYRGRRRTNRALSVRATALRGVGGSR